MKTITKQKEELFLSLINGLKIKIETEDNRVIYLNEKGEWVIMQGIINREVWLSYDRIWRIFEREYDMNYQEIKEFTYAMVCKHLGWKGYTTKCVIKTIIG